MTWFLHFVNSICGFGFNPHTLKAIEVDLPIAFLVALLSLIRLFFTNSDSKPHEHRRAKHARASVAKAPQRIAIGWRIATYPFAVLYRKYRAWKSLGFYTHRHTCYWWLYDENGTVVAVRVTTTYFRFGRSVARTSKTIPCHPPTSRKKQKVG
jgi:hypothetical protein